VADVDATFLTPITLDVDTKEVKDVTKGVREVELEDKSEEALVSNAAPETIPLPEGESGELDEPASGDIDDAPEPTEDDKTPESVHLVVRQSTPTPPVTEDCEGLKPEEEEVEEESTSVEPTNDVNS